MKPALLLSLLLLLSACASKPPLKVATADSVSAALGVRQKTPTGFLGVEGASVSAGFRKKLDSLIGSKFDSSLILVPNYKGAKYKTKVAKEYLLDELMTEAYSAYKKVSGKKWYPKKAIKATKSQDPLLRGDRWLLKQGDTLHDVLSSWSRKANWQMVWRSDYEYPVRVGALFKGSFPKVVGDVLTDFENRKPRLYATFYKNRVVVIRNEAQ